MLHTLYKHDASLPHVKHDAVGMSVECSKPYDLYTIAMHNRFKKKEMPAEHKYDLHKSCGQSISGS